MRSFLRKLRSICISTMASMSISSMAIPAHAAGIDISPSGSGITIKPGRMPDMTTSISGLQSAIDEAVMPQIRAVATAVTSVCTIICLVAFLVSVTKLAASAGNPVARHRALTGILFSGVALALFGGACIVVAFFWNFLN